MLGIARGEIPFGKPFGKPEPITEPVMEPVTPTASPCNNKYHHVNTAVCLSSASGDLELTGRLLSMPSSQKISQVNTFFIAYKVDIFFYQGALCKAIEQSAPSRQRTHVLMSSFRTRQKRTKARVAVPRSLPQSHCEAMHAQSERGFHRALRHHCCARCHALHLD